LYVADYPLCSGFLCHSIGSSPFSPFIFYFPSNRACFKRLVETRASKKKRKKEKKKVNLINSAQRKGKEIIR